MDYAPGISSRFIERLVVNAADLTGPQGRCVMVWTGQEIARFNTVSSADIDEPLRRARAAQKEWMSRSAKQRAQVFHRFAQLCLRHKNRLISLSQVLSGSSRVDGYDEVVDSVNGSSAYAALSRHLHQEHRRLSILPFGSATYSERIPLGVVAMFTLSDFPVSQNSVDIFAANCGWQCGGAIYTRSVSARSVGNA